MDDHPRRGDVFFAFLDPVLGCEQGGTRPVLVVQNDAGNRRSKTIIVAAITVSASLLMNKTMCSI